MFLKIEGKCSEITPLLGNCSCSISVSGFCSNVKLYTEYMPLFIILKQNNDNHKILYNSIEEGKALYNWWHFIKLDECSSGLPEYILQVN